MKIQKGNYLLRIVICFILAGLLETGYAMAQDKPPSPPPVNQQAIKSTGGASMDKPPTSPPQEMKAEQTSPSSDGDIYPPTNPPTTKQSAEVGEATADSVNIPSSHGRTKGEIQKASQANAPKPTYEIKLKQGAPKPAIPKRTISK